MNIKQLPKGVKASIAFFVSSLVTKGIAYLTTPIFTRILTEEEYGQVSVFLTWLQVFGIIAMFCLSYGVFNNGMIEYPEKRDRYSFSLLILSNIITLSFFGILFCLYPVLSKHLKIGPYLLLLMFGVFLTQPAYNFWVSRQRYELKYKASLIWSIVSAVLSPSIAILCILFNKEGSNVYPRLFGAECTLIAIYIAFYVFLGIKSEWKIDIKFWKEAMLFNLPLIPHYLSTYLLGSSDKLMISFLVGDAEAAYYSVASSIAAVAAIIWTAINGSLIPYTYEKCKEKNFEDINRVTLPLITVFSVGCLIVILLGPEAVRLMATSNYMQAIYVIPPIVGGVFFQIQYYSYANVVYYYKKPLFVMIGSLTAVTANLILNYFCIKQWGYLAAGYTTIICYVIQATIDYFAMRKVVGKSIYNMKYILALSIIMIAVSLTSAFIYDFMVVRLSILALVLILLLIFRKKIMGIISFNKATPTLSSEKKNNDINTQL